MSKQQKALQRLCATPPPTDFTWDELVSLLKRLGYVLLKNKGSRRKFHNVQLDALIICHQPHPSPHVDRGCIVAVVEHLQNHGLI